MVFVSFVEREKCRPISTLSDDPRDWRLTGRVVAPYLEGDCLEVLKLR